MTGTSDGTVLLEWKRSNNEVARLVIDEWKRQRLLQLRIFYTDKDGGLKPSPRGLPIPYDQIRSLRIALKQARKELAADSKRGKKQER